jgi:DNA-directed RNA polymerase specialized sigma subunit
VDVPADSFELTVHINLPKSVEDHLKAAEAYRGQAAEANRRASEEARVAAKILAAEMPLREVGAVLDVSHQRVHQLVNS